VARGADKDEIEPRRVVTAHKTGQRWKFGGKDHRRPRWVSVAFLSVARV